MAYPGSVSYSWGTYTPLTVRASATSVSYRDSWRALQSAMQRALSTRHSWTVRQVRGRGRRCVGEGRDEEMRAQREERGSEGGYTSVPCIQYRMSQVGRAGDSMSWRIMHRVSNW